MRLKLISCQSIAQEVKASLRGCPHQVECEFVEKAAHNRPDGLRSLLQERIDATEGQGFDAILLGYGLCGNGTQGLQARSIPLVMARAHDCATLFLGSRKRFEKVFRHALSTPYSSAGYMASDGAPLHESRSSTGDPPLEELVLRFGEEDGLDIWNTLHQPPQGSRDKRMVWISVPETECKKSLERCQELAQDQGREVSVEKGDLSLIRRLLWGDWADDEFLRIPPGATVEPAWDWDRVVKLKRPPDRPQGDR